MQVSCDAVKRIKPIMITARVTSRKYSLLRIKFWDKPEEILRLVAVSRQAKLRRRKDKEEKV